MQKEETRYEGKKSVGQALNVQSEAHSHAVIPSKHKSTKSTDNFSPPIVIKPYISEKAISQQYKKQLKTNHIFPNVKNSSINKSNKQAFFHNQPIQAKFLPKLLSQSRSYRALR